MHMQELNFKTLQEQVTEINRFYIYTSQGLKYPVNTSSSGYRQELLQEAEAVALRQGSFLQ